MGVKKGGIAAGVHAIKSKGQMFKGAPTTQKKIKTR
jgi:hypothetical protein